PSMDPATSFPLERPRRSVLTRSRIDPHSSRSPSTQHFERRLHLGRDSRPGSAYQPDLPVEHLDGEGRTAAAEPELEGASAPDRRDDHRELGHELTVER